MFFLCTKKNAAVQSPEGSLCFKGEITQSLFKIFPESQSRNFPFFLQRGKVGIGEIILENSGP